ncbi:uncharacterized protein K460DRAFT_414796 [Cucurbitaria berberidis CBS 394.84]|uniref:Uncharacterized protein n=1 Tax=Cucurbitaria berberidis CBS 394.84 TaxID=1168544 RepID=A0A9P4LAN1_9PLEO|nr:uncharacterized protein K460DRAFT_414796 [Cucurbitaria berberidis CBS 394.84]KAF1848210.1 hypothetical protein K460DRAFT_414796 [Cucurbitaria berberidis CBS 394.84]
MACAYTKDGSDPISPWPISTIQLRLRKWGKYVNEASFEDIALAAWSWYGDDLELKTRDELEGRGGGYTEYDSEASEASSIALIEDGKSSRYGKKDRHAAIIKANAVMTLEDAIRIQRDFFSGGNVARDRIESSFEKYGHITPENFVDLSGEADGDTTSEDTASPSPSKRSYNCNGAPIQTNKRPRQISVTFARESDAASSTFSWTKAYLDSCDSAARDLDLEQGESRNVSEEQDTDSDDELSHAWEEFIANL